MANSTGARAVAVFADVAIVGAPAFYLAWLSAYMGNAFTQANMTLPQATQLATQPKFTLIVGIWAVLTLLVNEARTHNDNRRLVVRSVVMLVMAVWYSVILWGLTAPWTTIMWGLEE